MTDPLFLGLFVDVGRPNEIFHWWELIPNILHNRPVLFFYSRTILQNWLMYQDLIVCRSLAVFTLPIKRRLNENRLRDELPFFNVI